MKWIAFLLISRVHTLLTKPRLRTVNSALPEISSERAVSLIYSTDLSDSSAALSIPSLPLSHLLMSPVAELRSPRLSYRLSPVPAPRYICRSTHTDINTHIMQYNAHAGLFCEANFIVTPLGPSFLSFAHRVMACSAGSSSWVWTCVNGCCANMSDEIKWRNKRTNPYISDVPV